MTRPSCTTADAMEVMNAVVACHQRTAPRWHDDPETHRFTASVWAEGLSYHRLTSEEAIAGVKKRAFETTDIAPELGEVIQFARAVRRDRTEREDADARRAREDAQDAKLAALGVDPDVRKAIAPAVAKFGNLERPATRPGGGTRSGVRDPDRLAAARAELAGRVPVEVPQPSEGADSCRLGEPSASESEVSGVGVSDPLPGS